MFTTIVTTNDDNLEYHQHCYWVPTILLVIRKFSIVVVVAAAIVVIAVVAIIISMHDVFNELWSGTEQILKILVDQTTTLLYNCLETGGRGT